MQIDDGKTKPRSQQYKISGYSSYPITLKQQTNHEQHQSQYQQPRAVKFKGKKCVTMYFSQKIHLV